MLGRSLPDHSSLLIGQSSIHRPFHLTLVGPNLGAILSVQWTSFPANYLKTTEKRKFLEQFSLRHFLSKFLLLKQKLELLLQKSGIQIT